MTTTTLLNLDELIPEAQYVQFRGEKHLMVAATTETYLKIVRAQKKLSASSERADEEEQAKFAIELISLAIPSIPREELMKFPLAVNMKLVEVIQNEMTKDMEEASPGSTKEGGHGQGELILLESLQE